jgi:NAD(P)-dependent dehydrogenase (short-subunit alcohol dehydrogenase family)
MNIIITGASSGVGFEAALELILSGKHRVIVLARSEQKLGRLFQIAQGLNPEATLYPVAFDIVHDDYDWLLQFIQTRFENRVDILINNAGVLINKPFMQLLETDFVEMLQGNYIGHIRMIKHILPLMPPGAHILNIGSMGGFQGSAKFRTGLRAD